MNLFIPALGTRLKLVFDWTFELHSEYRNHDLWVALGHEKPVSLYAWRWSDDDNLKQKTSTLPAETVLVVDRIYIRKGSSDFNSVTFRIDDCPDARLRTKKKKGMLPKSARFWVKLSDANNLVVEIV